MLPARITPDHEEHDAHALLEALACGIPSIGSTSGIIPEVLAHESGLIFKAGDVNDLKLKLLSLIESPDLRKSLSSRAVETATHSFSIDSIARCKLEIYASLIE